MTAAEIRATARIVVTALRNTPFSNRENQRRECAISSRAMSSAPAANGTAITR
jgi:hypothetical protein